MVTHASPGAPQDASDEESEFSLEQAKELAGLLLRAPRRHRSLAIVTLVLTLAIGIAAALLWPRTFACSTRILAQHNLVLPALDNPTRAVPRDAENLTRNAADTILRRDNVVAMIKQLDLLARWKTTRQPLLRLKDKLTFARERTEEERTRDMVELLDKRLGVLNDDSSITISAEWPDREIAFEMVSFLQKNFLEARYDSNVNVIVEAIHILEERAKTLSAEIDEALANVTKIEDERRAAVKAASPTPSPAPIRRASGRARAAAVSAPPDTHSVTQSPEVNESTRELEEVRRRIQLLQDEHDHGLAQAESQLADARATLGPMHPTVVDLNEKIQSLSRTSPELGALKTQEQSSVASPAFPGPRQRWEQRPRRAGAPRPPRFPAPTTWWPLPRRPHRSPRPWTCATTPRSLWLSLACRRSSRSITSSFGASILRASSST